jgi:hypothetical protein
MSEYVADGGGVGAVGRIPLYELLYTFGEVPKRFKIQALYACPSKLLEKRILIRDIGIPKLVLFY